MTDTIPWGDPRSIWPGPEWLAPRVLRDCPRCGWRRYAGNAGHHPCNGCGTLLRFVSVATAESEDVAVALRTRGIALGHVRARARMRRFRLWLAEHQAPATLRYAAEHATSPEVAVRRLDELEVRWLAWACGAESLVHYHLVNAGGHAAPAARALTESDRWASLPWQQEPAPRG
jgi:hypothetical protein